MSLSWLMVEVGGPQSHKQSKDMSQMLFLSKQKPQHITSFKKYIEIFEVKFTIWKKRKKSEISDHSLISRLASLVDLVCYKGILEQDPGLVLHNLPFLVQRISDSATNALMKQKAPENNHTISWELPVVNVSTHSSWLSLWGLSYPIQCQLAQTMGGGQPHQYNPFTCPIWSDTGMKGHFQRVSIS